MNNNSTSETTVEWKGQVWWGGRKWFWKPLALNLPWDLLRIQNLKMPPTTSKSGQGSSQPAATQNRLTEWYLHERSWTSQVNLRHRWRQCKCPWRTMFHHWSNSNYPWISLLRKECPDSFHLWVTFACLDSCFPPHPLMKIQLAPPIHSFLLSELYHPYLFVAKSRSCVVLGLLPSSASCTCVWPSTSHHTLFFTLICFNIY